MSSDNGYGFHLPFGDAPLAQTRAAIEELAACGYTDVWSAEAGAYDGLTPLAMAAAWAPSLRTGAAILPAFTRGPALLAMSAAAMADASPAGFTLGIGASSQPIVENWNGIPFTAPYARVRDTVRFLRKALAGERVDEEFPSFTIRGFRLEQLPARPPTLLVAALRPQMLRLAGAESDGTILNWLAPRDIPTIAAEVGPGKQLVTKMLVCLEPDEAVFAQLARRTIAGYLTVPTYAAYQTWLGRAVTLQPMWDAWAAGDRKAALELVPDSLIEELFVFGSRAECRDGIARYVDAGATTPVVCALPGGASALETMRALAP